MPGSDLANLQNLMEGIKPLLTRSDNVERVKRMRNEVQADWLDNFITTMDTKPEGSTFTEDPTINKETGFKHTVESMVSELSQRVGLEALSKVAGKYTPKALSALSKLRSQEAGTWAGIDSLESEEKSELAAALKSIDRKKTAAPVLSIKKANKDLDGALKKIRTCITDDDGKICRWSEIDELSEEEIRALVTKLEKTADVNSVATKEDLEKITNYVEGKLVESGNYAGLEQILSGIMGEKNMGEMASRLGRENIKKHVAELLETAVRPEQNSLLPQAKPGNTGMRSRLSSDPNDPNRFMFTSSNPAATYV